jgi:hypothetical protein
MCNIAHALNAPRSSHIVLRSQLKPFDLRRRSKSSIGGTSNASARDDASVPLTWQPSPPPPALIPRSPSAGVAVGVGGPPAIVTAPSLHTSSPRRGPLTGTSKGGMTVPSGVEPKAKSQRTGTILGGALAAI